MSPSLLARRLAAVAGSLDFFTGLGLVAAPTFTLRCMFVPPVSVDALVFVRFVGVFVSMVGGSYLWALARPSERLRVVLGNTRLFRLAVGVFTGVAVLSGALPPAWLVVTVADLTLAGLQTWLLAQSF